MKNILLILVAFTSLLSNASNARDLDLRITYLPFSDHYGDSNVTNETHNGIGFTASLSDAPIYVGAMRYKNSYDHMSNLYYAGVETCMSKVEVCIGAMGGYVTGYEEDELEYPLMGGATLRYKWVAVIAIPGELNALLFTIPIEEITWRN